MILTVLEHQKIYIGHKRDLSKFQISKADAELIRLIDINNNGIFKWGNKYLIPQQWIGIISLPELSIEILPKIADDYNFNEVKEILLYMLKVAHNIPTKKNIDSKVNFNKNGLIEILISNFIKHVEIYVKEGMISTYQKTTRNLSSIKGCIDFSKQINKNLLNPTRFICKYSMLDSNNNINKYIKYTLVEMKKISRDNLNIKRLNSLLIYFEEIDTLSKDQVKKTSIDINRINSRVKQVIDYCNLFLNSSSVSLSSGEYLVSSMLFDMNKLFEVFIYRCYKMIYGTNVVYQDNSHYLIEDRLTKKKKIRLKPDIILSMSKNSKLIIDTKWKVVKSFAKESDIYQMNAYVSAIGDVNTILLLYPKTDSTNRIVGDYNFYNYATKKELRIRTVDLSLINNQTEFIEHLKDLVL